ncbi:MAG: hypothetical protein AABW88_03690 [Nanoarchaeota archaeon]
MRAIRYARCYGLSSSVQKELCIYVPTCSAVFILSQGGILSVYPTKSKSALNSEVIAVQNALEVKINEASFNSATLTDIEELEITNKNYSDLIWAVNTRPHEITYSKHRKNLEGILFQRSLVLQK